MCPFLVFLAVAAAVPAEKPVFQANFDPPADSIRWNPSIGSTGVSLAAGWENSKSLAIEAADASGRSIRTVLPIEAMRGARLQVTAWIRAENVGKPPQHWNGIKCMMHIVTPGGDHWPQQPNLSGTFDWRHVKFGVIVPEDATSASLVLGLEKVSGKVWFDDVRISIVGRARVKPATTPAGPVYKGHDLPRLRGAMIGPRVGEADLRVLAGECNGNHVRWQLIWGGFPRSPADKGDLAAYDQWLESELKRLDDLLPVCRELGIRVALDLHTPPGGRNDASECQLFHERRFQDAFIRCWEMMAKRYRGNATIWGYDLVNEPVEGVIPDGLMNWQSLAEATAKRVRAIDPDHAIIVEPAPWGGPDGLDWFEPIDVPRVVYSVHMYIPHQFTHQGVHGQTVGVHYPGEIGGKRWDKEQLKKALAPVVRFQRDYGVHIYLGEFSAIRWAPGDSARQYLSDCIDIFEENGWDWAYHAFREWDGWSVEHGPDPKNHERAATPTDRQKLLQSWFAKNKK